MLECLYMRHWVVFYCLIVSIFLYTTCIDSYWIAFICHRHHYLHHHRLVTIVIILSTILIDFIILIILILIDLIIIIILILVDLIIIISLISSSSFLSNVGEVIGEFQQKLLIFTNNSRTSNAVLEINYKAVGR